MISKEFLRQFTKKVIKIKRKKQELLEKNKSKKLKEREEKIRMRVIKKLEKLTKPKKVEMPNYMAKIFEARLGKKQRLEIPVPLPLEEASEFKTIIKTPVSTHSQIPILPKPLPVFNITEKKQEKKKKEKAGLENLIPLRQSELPPVPLPSSTQQPSAKPPAQQAEINFGKISSLVMNESIKLIQCDGAGKQIVVREHGKLVFTDIILNENEINNIIESFASVAGVQISSVFEASFQNLKMLAWISKQGSNFIISKI